MVLQPGPANWRQRTVNSSKAKHRFIFMRKNSFWNLSFSSAVKSLSPVIMTEKYLRMLKRNPSDKQDTSQVCCWTSWMIALKKHLSSVWIYILLRERELHAKKPANHCHSVPNLACLAGLWHSPLALLVPTLGSQANTSTYSKPESVGSYLKYNVWWIATAWDQSNSTAQSFLKQKGITAAKRHLP